MAATDFAGIQTELLVALAQAPPPYNVIPPDFAALLPQAIGNAELRIYRDIVLLATRKENSTSLVAVAGTRSLDLSAITPTIIVPEAIGLIEPISGTLATGAVYWFDESSLDAVEMLWPQQSATMAPSDADWVGRRWAMLDDHTAVISPTPDAAYPVVVVGLYQPATLSGSNTTSYLSTTYPDLLFAACMSWLTGALLRNYGSQAADPATAVSWESSYAALMASARGEEFRRRGLQPDIATPPQAARAGR